MIVEKNPGVVKRRFTNHFAQPSISPKSVQSFHRSPLSLKDWQFVKSGLTATLDAADEGDILIRTGNNRVTVRGQVSSGEVSTEYVGSDAPHEVIVDKAFLVNAFSQQSTYPPDAVSMTISDSRPVVVDFKDAVTRLTVALSPRID